MTKRIHDTCGIFDYGYKTVWYGKALKYMPYASAGVCTDKDGTIRLVSYETTVITINPEGWLECTGTYSATTRKHIGAFMKEYTPFGYYTAKECYERKQRINIWNGRIEKL